MLKWNLLQSDSNLLPALRQQPLILLLLSVLLSFGLILIASASIPIASAKLDVSYYYWLRQSIFLCIGGAGLLWVATKPIAFWEKNAFVVLLFSLLLLVLVLFPSVGTSVNGSRRWIRLAFFNVQPSEIAKFTALIFFARSLAKWRSQPERINRGSLGLLILLGFICGLVVVEPDLGTCVVLSVTLLSIMFLAGMPLIFCLAMAAAGAGLFGAAVWLTPYRLERVKTFLDPWQVAFDSGYQLTQSLIGFGRGDWWGVGLGNSIQKQFFLPEAHTDFIFAIAAEELGFIGALLILAVFAVLVGCIFQVATQAAKNHHFFSSYLCFGVAIMLAIEVGINVGVASGLLPTKGLTLPFISYGGSSLVIHLMLMGLVFQTQSLLYQTQSNEQKASSGKTPPRRKRRPNKAPPENIAAVSTAENSGGDMTDDIDFDHGIEFDRENKETNRV